MAIKITRQTCGTKGRASSANEQLISVGIVEPHKETHVPIAQLVIYTMS